MYSGSTPTEGGAPAAHLRMLRHLFVAGGVSQLAAIKGLLIVPLVAKSLGADGLGIWSQTLVFAAFVTPIGSLSLEHAIYRFLPARSLEDRRPLTSAVFAVIALAGALLSIGLYVAAAPLAALVYGGRDAELVRAATLVAAATLPSSILVAVLAYFASVRDTKTFGKVVLIREGLELLAAAVTGITGQSVIFLLVAWAAIRWLVGVGGALAIAGRRGFGAVDSSVTPGELARYTAPLMAVHPIAWITKYVDRLAVAWYLGTTGAGYYAAGLYLAGLPQLALEPLMQILPAWLSRATDLDGAQETRSLLRFSIGGYLTLAVPAVCGATLLADPILQLLTNPEVAAAAATVVPIAGVAFLFYGVQTIVVEQIKAQKRALTVLGTWSLNPPIALALSWLLVPRFGLRGAAFALLGTYTILAATVLWKSGCAAWLIPGARWLGTIAAATAAMIAAVLAADRWANAPLGMAIGTGVVVYALVGAAVGGVTRDDVRRLASALSKK